MKFFKTFFVLICVAVLNVVFCFNYTLCSDLIQRSENNLRTSKNAEKFAKNYIETSLKRYAVYKYKNDKILCEPYRVSKNDWLYKIFRKKGEISEKDFPLFINIFKTVNPGINDIDAIRPGQIILIPLKKIHDNDFRETSPGVVDVPMIEFASIPEVVKPFITRHRVKKGETISQLLDSVFLNKDGTINAEGMRALKLSNPDIKDVNLIYAGSIVNIPSASLDSQPWFQKSSHILNKTANKSNSDQKNHSDLKSNSNQKRNSDQKDKKIIKPKQSKTITKNNQDRINYKYTLSKVLEKYASVVDGRLIHTGRFYFPRINKPDIVLDLKSHPVIELANGGKILISPDRRNSNMLFRTIGKFWKNLKVITLTEAVDYLSMKEPENNANQLKIEKTKPGKEVNRETKNNRKQPVVQDMATFKVINLNAKKEILPPGHEAALKKILGFTRFQYTPDEKVSLSFNSISLNVKLGKIYSKARPDVLVDFGTIYGYALDIIRKKGYHIISFPPKDRFLTSLSKLFIDLAMSVTMDPVFVSAETNREITINGLYIAGNMIKSHIGGLLITGYPLGKETMSFLNQKNIKILCYTKVKRK